LHTAATIVLHGIHSPAAAAAGTGGYLVILVHLPFKAGREALPVIDYFTVVIE
jgi:hypothetical protein